MCVLGGGPQRRPAGVDVPFRSGMPPAFSTGKLRAGWASTVLLLLLQLCDPVLLMEGMDVTKGGVHTLIFYFQQNYTLVEP